MATRQSILVAAMHRRRQIFLINKGRAYAVNARKWDVFEMSQWYFRRNGCVTGPMTEPAIRTYLLENTLIEEDEVRKELGDWLDAHEIRKQFELLVKYGWVVIDDGKEIGPFTAERMLQFHKNGKITDDTLVRQGDGDIASYSDVKMGIQESFSRDEILRSQESIPRIPTAYANSRVDAVAMSEVVASLPPPIPPRAKRHIPTANFTSCDRRNIAGLRGSSSVRRAVLLLAATIATVSLLGRSFFSLYSNPENQPTAGVKTLRSSATNDVAAYLDSIELPMVADPDYGVTKLPPTAYGGHLSSPDYRFKEYFERLDDGVVHDASLFLRIEINRRYRGWDETHDQRSRPRPTDNVSVSPNYYRSGLQPAKSFSDYYHEISKEFYSVVVLGEETTHSSRAAALRLRHATESVSGGNQEIDALLGHEKIVQDLSPLVKETKQLHSEFSDACHLYFQLRMAAEHIRSIERRCDLEGDTAATAAKALTTMALDGVQGQDTERVELLRKKQEKALATQQMLKTYGELYQRLYGLVDRPNVNQVTEKLAMSVDRLSKRIETAREHQDLISKSLTGHD